MMKSSTPVVLLALVFCGCSSMQTSVEQSPDAKFDNYSTWDWFPGEPMHTAQPSLELGEKATEYLRATIERNMAERRYQRSETSPQLYVDYHVTIQDEVNTMVINNYYGESWYPDYRLDLPGIQDTYDYRWTQGALLILVFDAKSKSLLWRGLAQTEVNTQGPIKKAKETIDKAVEKLLSKLPKGAPRRS
jgi:hypothetical protein